MARPKRKDKTRTVLRTGELQRSDGSYQYSWTDENHKRRYVYSKTLEALRIKEEAIEKDKSDGIKAEARYVTLDDLYELWKDLKRGLKNNTFENYKYMYETFVRNQIGSQFIMSIKKTDIKRYYNSLVDERHLKPATIDSIHTVLHQVFEMAVDDDYIRRIQKNTGSQVIKAFSVKAAQDIELALKSPADYILLDQGGGGTGQTFDWSLIPEIKRPFFLAGGLGADNLEQAVDTIRHYA